MPSLYRPIVIGFGRFNPPTTGHAQHIEFIRKQAERLHADHRIYASVSQDPRKNPLPFSEKVRFLEQLFPHAKFSTNAGVRTPFAAFSECAAAGYTDLFVVVSGERVPEFQRFAKYFAKPGTPGYREGSSIPMSYTVVDSGRSMNTEHRVSGTQQRRFASDGNYAAFRQHVPTTNDQIAKNLYRSVRVHMGLHEMFNVISGQFAINLFEAHDTYAVMAIEHDRVVWQMWDVEKSEITLAAKTAREKHPHATVSVENKSGKIVKVFKPGESIHEAVVTEAAIPSRDGAKLLVRHLNIARWPAASTAHRFNTAVTQQYGAAVLKVIEKHTNAVWPFLHGGLRKEPPVAAQLRRQLGVSDADFAKEIKNSGKGFDLRMYEDHIKVGDYVHAGFAVKGGAGFSGRVDKIEGNRVYVNVSKDKSVRMKDDPKWGDRIIIAPTKNVTVQEAIHATFGQKMTAASIVYKAITGEHRIPSHLESPEALVNAAILVFADPNKRLTPEGWKIAGQMLQKMDELGVKWNKASLRPLTLRALGLTSIHEERMPLKGHPWHRKSDEELRYIIRDAGKAAEAMRGHNRTAEDKYRDQVNDASSILYYRRNGGKRIEEAEVSTPKEPTETDRLRTKQQQELITLKQRQANDMMAAKLRDVQQKSREQLQKINAPKPAAKPAS